MGQKEETGLVQVESFDGVTFPITEHVAKADLPDGRTFLTGQKVLVKEGKQIMGVMPEHYAIVPHIDVQGGMERVLQAQKLEYQKEMFATPDGNKSLMKYRIPGIVRDIDPKGGGDQTCLELHVDNDIMGGKTTIESGGLRLVCVNGLVAWDAVEKIRRKPEEGVQVEYIGEMVNRSIQCFEERLVPKWQGMAQDDMSLQEAMIFLGLLNLPQVYFELAVEELQKLQAEALTAWIVYNVVTFVASHRASTIEVGRSIHKRATDEILKHRYCYHGKPHRIMKEKPKGDV